MGMGGMHAVVAAMQTNSLISFDFAVDDHLPVDLYICI